MIRFRGYDGASLFAFARGTGAAMVLVHGGDPTTTASRRWPPRWPTATP